MAYSLFHTVKYKNHSVGYIFHTVGYKSRSVKQRIDKGILGNIEGVFYFHIVRHAVSVFFCMVVIYENRYDEHKKYTAMRTIFVLLGLRAAGVAEEQMEVVPGVSSFLATAAALKQEYTLPNISQTIIITRMEGRTPMPEKEKLSMLAQHQATMCIFLSIQGINTVMSQLKDGGYPGDTPVAIVVRATWPDQKILRGTIDTIADVIHAEGVVRQAMIVVGRVLDTDYELSKLYDSSFTTMFRQGTDKK